MMSTVVPFRVVVYRNPLRLDEVRHDSEIGPASSAAEMYVPLEATNRIPINKSGTIFLLTSDAVILTPEK